MQDPTLPATNDWWGNYLGRYSAGNSNLFHRPVLTGTRKVTEEEEVYIKSRPFESERMLEDSPFLKAAGPIIRSHHEKWDGTGYTNGLVGTQIPKLTRLLSAAVYYCSQHTLGEPALNMLRARVGTFFDAEVVDTVVEASIKAEIPKGIREVLLNDLKHGQVVGKDVHYFQPRISESKF